jgi:small membrane protein
MHLIQPLLLASFLVALYFYLRFLRSSVRDRLLALSFFVVACIAVLVPNSTNRLANLVGVGRGTDLTFYLFAVGFVYFVVLAYSRFSRLDRALTEVVRKLAIMEAVAPTRTGRAPSRPDASTERV